MTGVHVPADYCQANPTLATPCSHQSAPGSVGTKALVSWPYDRTGDSPAPADEATFEQIGATYGLAHRRDTDQLFVGALTKRLMPYGPAGPGGIYVVDRKTKQTSLFATVPDAGDAKHSADLTRDTLEINDAVGKEALGDLDLADDGHTLYAVGLKAKSLYVYDTTGAGPGKPAARPQRTLAIPDPGCPSGAADWRPYGLGFHDGALYLGGTCSAESSQKDADLRAYVLKLSGTSFSTVVSHDLAFEQGMGYSSVKGDTHWRHWLRTWDPYAWFQQANFPSRSCPTSSSTVTARWSWASGTGSATRPVTRPCRPRAPPTTPRSARCSRRWAMSPGCARRAPSGCGTAPRLTAPTTSSTAARRRSRTG